MKKPAGSISEQHSISIRLMLEEIPSRTKEWHFEAAGLQVNFARSVLTEQTLAPLLAQADKLQLRSKITGMMNGGLVNATEGRAAHHCALRAFLTNNGTSSNNEHEQLASKSFSRVCDIANQFRNKQWLGATGQPIRDVVNIGIGGSDLGPRLICSALKPAQQTNNSSTPNVHFVSNIDPSELNEVLAQCLPESTVFIVASKSFSTQETLANASTAKHWLSLKIEPSKQANHFLAATAKTEAAVNFGVAQDNVLPLWDWVGGRYSLWSAIGLPIAIALGSDQFKALLQGARMMDEHFEQTPLHKNIPALLAMLEIIYVNKMDVSSIAILPYSHRLRLLPNYLQQLCMESNGKSITTHGKTVKANTCPVIWGAAGTVGQHSFHQLLHQGTQVIPVDFILPLLPEENTPEKSTVEESGPENDHHLQLVAHCLAQSKALTDGKPEQQAYDELLTAGMSPEQAATLAPHKSIAGNKPNTIIVMDQLNAASLGALIAMYEHKVFVESVMWEINAFDQWGVELGKQLSRPISAALADHSKSKTDTNNGIDATTHFWVSKYQRANMSRKDS